MNSEQSDAITARLREMLRESADAKQTDDERKQRVRTNKQKRRERKQRNRTTHDLLDARIEPAKKVVARWDVEDALVLVQHHTTCRCGRTYTYPQQPLIRSTLHVGARECKHYREPTELLPQHYELPRIVEHIHHTTRFCMVCFETAESAPRLPAPQHEEPHAKRPVDQEPLS